LIVRPEKSYLAANVQVNGHAYKRQRIDVLMDFTNADGCREISRRLRPGFVGVSPTRVRAHKREKDVPLF
jgi:hypothetical protein